MDLFNDYDVQDEISQGVDLQFLPISSVSNDGPFDFQIVTNSDNSFLSLPHTKLVGSFRVMKRVNGVPQNIDVKGDDVDVGIVNLLSAALIKSIDVSVNGQRTNTSTSHGYAYKAYINSLLSYSSDVKSTVLWPSLWLSLIHI